MTLIIALLAMFVIGAVATLAAGSTGLLGGFFAVRALRRALKARTVHAEALRDPVIAIAEMGPGPVRVRGRVVAPETQVSPSGKLCVAYELKGQFAASPFVLHTPAGAVLIVSTAYDLVGSAQEEAVLTSGEQVIVEGIAEPILPDLPAPPNVTMLINGDEAHRLRVIFASAEVSKLIDQKVQTAWRWVVALPLIVLAIVVAVVFLMGLLPMSFFVGH